MQKIKKLESLQDQLFELPTTSSSLTIGGEYNQASTKSFKDKYGSDVLVIVDYPKVTV